MLFFLYYMCFVTLLYLIGPLLPILFDQIKPLNQSRPRVILFQVEYFLDEEKYKMPMIIHAFIFTPLPTTVAVAYDVMFATSIHHASSIFRIVGKRLQFSINDMERHGPKMDILLVQTELRRALVESIRLHRDILQFVDLLQAIFSTSLFIMNILTMINLSMTAYQAVNNSGNSARLVGFASYAIGQLIRLYFRSWHGQMLTNSSESVFDSVYQADWYDLPFRLRRFIILILARGKKQSKITAGKLFDMSMENFTFVVRTAISYFTVLRSMQ
uniref:Olfactory receptor 82 n=1 Tax=Meteorus pulchricornis TaxID=51522 RepID=A0A1S5VFS2_9HYME|nr:olfactory receptor 82 [Meteorus pulchricornis]